MQRPGRGIHKAVRKLFKQAKFVLAWNADFDERMLRQTASRYDLQWKTNTDFMTGCLQEACSHEGAPYDKSKAHRAPPDCYNVLDVMRAYVKNEIQLYRQSTD